MFLWNTLISFNVLAPGAGRRTGFKHFYLDVKISFVSFTSLKNSKAFFMLVLKIVPCFLIVRIEQTEYIKLENFKSVYCSQRVVHINLTI